VAIWEHRLESGNEKNVASPGNLHDWRDRATAIEAMAATSMNFPLVVQVDGVPTEINGMATEHDFFRVLGLDPVLGNHFDPESDEQQLLLTHGLWQRQFGGDPAVIGRALTINGQPTIVTGVLPDEFIVWGEEAEIFFSNSLEGVDRTNSGRWLTVVGRLAEGATVEQARAEMIAIGRQLAEEDPGFNSGWSVNTLSLKEEVVGDSRALMLLLLGAVGLLLLIACANVANLLLARGTGRQQEMAVRTSLGADRGSLVRQMLVEAGILATAGATLGLAMAHYGSRAIAGSLPGAFGLPRTDAVGMDLSVLLFALGALVLTTILFGLVPSLQAARVEPAAVLAGEMRGSSRRGGRMRDALVAGEVALSMILLVGATLMARSFTNLMAVDSGLEPENVVTARISLTAPEYDEEGARPRFSTQLEERLRALPGVESVGTISWLPFNGIRAGTSYWTADRPKPTDDELPAADILNVTGDYFDAMGIDFVAGRPLDATDREDTPRVAVVNQTLAGRHWPDGDAVGQRVVFHWRGEEEVEIVGVIADVRADGLSEEVDEAIYMPLSQTPFFDWFNVVIRSSAPPATVVEGLRSAMAELDPSVPVPEVQILEDMVARSVARPRVSAALMLLFAGIAAVLAAIGLYGVLSYTVERRVREIGVRVALGASPESVLGLVVGQGTRMILVGLVVGAIGAVATTGLLESLLFGVAPRDWISLGAAALFLLVVGLAACVIPAVRAMRVAPVRALTAE